MPELRVTTPEFESVYVPSTTVEVKPPEPKKKSALAIGDWKAIRNSQEWSNIPNVILQNEFGGDEQYLPLAEDQAKTIRGALRDHFFDTVIAKDNRYDSLSETEKDDFYAKFHEVEGLSSDAIRTMRRKPSAPVGEALKAFAWESIASAPTAAGQALYQAGDITGLFGVKEAGEGILKAGEAIREEKGLAPYIASNADKWAYMFGAGASSILQAFALRKVGGVKAPAIAFGVKKDLSKYVEMRERGESPLKSFLLSGAEGITEGALEGILPTGGPGGYSGPLRQFVSSAITEALQESSQELAGNLWDRVYDPEKRSLKGAFTGVIEAGILGAVLGGPAGLAVDVQIDQAAKSAIDAAGIDTKSEGGKQLVKALKRSMHDQVSGIESAVEEQRENEAAPVKGEVITDEELEELQDEYIESTYTATDASRGFGPQSAEHFERDEYDDEGFMAWLHSDKATKGYDAEFIQMVERAREAMPQPTTEGGETHPVDRFFEPRLIEDAKNVPSKSRELLVYMSPDDFLKMAKSLTEADKEKAARISKAMDEGKPFHSLPSLGFENDGKGNAIVTSHEGRHRAMAFKAAGINEMPVVLVSVEGGGGPAIRWGEQTDAESRDRVQGPWPATMVEQEGKRTIPFPVDDLRQVKQQKPALTQADSEIGEAGFADVRLAKRALDRVLRYTMPGRNLSKEQQYAEKRRLGGNLRRTFNANKTFQGMKEALSTQDDFVVKQAMDYMVGQEELQNLPPEIQEAMQAARRSIDRMSKLLIRSGAVSEKMAAIFKENLGKYVTLQYRIFADPSFTPSAKAFNDLSAWLQNDMEIDKPTADAILNEHLESLASGEVISRGSAHPHISQILFRKRKNIPKEFKAFYGEILDPREAYAAAMARLIPMVENALYMKRLRSAGIGTIAPTPQTPKRLEGSKYGAMEGAWVDRNVYAELQSLDASRAGWEVLVERFITNPFKMAKTVLNPATHGRNVMANFILSIPSGASIFNPLNWRHYVRAGRIITDTSGRSDSIWSAMLGNGIIGSEYVGNDLRALGRQLAESGNPIDTMLDWAKKPFRAAAKMYNAEDQIFKIALALKVKEQGGTWAQAAEQVDLSYPNYNKVPIILQELRRFPLGKPFISFQAETLRIAMARQYEAGRIIVNALKAGDAVGAGVGLGKSALGLASLTALGTPFLSVGGLGLIGLAMSKIGRGIDPEEMERLRRQMPEWKRYRTYVPIRKDDGSIILWDTTYTDPFGEIKTLASQIMAGDIVSVPESFLGQQPAFSAVAAIVTGRDTFTGDKIAPLDAKGWEEQREILNYLYRLGAPSLAPSPTDIGLGKKGLRRLPGGYEYENLRRAARGQTPQTAALARSLVGVRTERVNQYETRIWYLYNKKKLVEEIQKETMRELRQALPEERPEALVRGISRIRRQVEDIRETEAPER